MLNDRYENGPRRPDVRGKTSLYSTTPIGRQALQNSLSAREIVATYTVPKAEWEKDANCGTSDPEAFFPTKGGSTKEVKKICNRCTVAMQCLAYALSNEKDGVWGGTSVEERRKIKRR